MIDIETMGTRSTSMIVQIGACYFDRETGEIGETFKRNIANEGDSFTVDWSTINWWLKQSLEARESITGNGKELKFVLQELEEFLQDAKYTWSHATFDIPLLSNAFYQYGMKFPVPYWNARDIRTLMDLTDHVPGARKGTHHNALDDCKFQVEYCVEALNKKDNVATV